MPKKTNVKQRKKLTFTDIVKGNFLNREEVKINRNYLLLIIALFLIMIYSNHLVNKKIERINTLKEEVEKYKSQNVYAQSRLIKIKLESELGKDMLKDSLLPLETHPMKLLIKTDSTDAANK